MIGLFRSALSEEAIESAVEVLRSGWLGQGAKVEEFEAAFAEWVGAPHCVATETGTAAMHIALRVLDLPAGSEVVTSPMTWVAGHHVILHERCRPVLAEIQPETGNLDPADVERRITRRTGALMLVHYGGYPCDLDELYDVAARHELPVIEDCAHAAGAEYAGRLVGAAPSLQCFSFGPIKNLITIHGGAVTTSDPRHVDRLRRLRSLGFERSIHQRLASGSTSYRRAYELPEAGFRYELSDVAAAIGLAQLRCLEAENARRREIAAAYAAGLADVSGVELLRYAEDRRSAYHLYPILVDRRDALAEALASRGVDVGVHYPLNPLVGDAPRQARRFAARTLTLPLHPAMSDEEVDTVVGAVRAGW